MQMQTAADDRTSLYSIQGDIGGERRVLYEEKLLITYEGSCLHDKVVTGRVGDNSIS